MRRRHFIKTSGLAAFAVAVSGKVILADKRFTGNTPTTSDILGSYYRPGAPQRININPAGYKGPVFHLNGIVRKSDGKTPMPDALVEIWQCDSNKMYDNTSEEFLYRGSQKTGADGKYHFITAHPVPHPTLTDPEINRPAHIHLRISGASHQDLVTQIYFKEDPDIANDRAANSSQSYSRILEVKQNSKGEAAVKFDVVLSAEVKLVDIQWKWLTGTYKMSDKSIMEFSRTGEALFCYWNGQIAEELIFRGENKFSGGLENYVARFSMQDNGDMKVDFYHQDLVSMKEVRIEGIRQK